MVDPLRAGYCLFRCTSHHFYDPSRITCAIRRRFFYTSAGGESHAAGLVYGERGRGPVDWEHSRYMDRLSVPSDAAKGRFVLVAFDRPRQSGLLLVGLQTLGATIANDVTTIEAL
jgi:hypothetical protein